MSKKPSASVVITTHNRKEDLEKAIASALKQSVPVEVIVIDDGSTDGTCDLIPQRFPEVRFVRCEESLGYIVQRNRGASLATGTVIFSIDDDAVFASSRTVEQTLQEFAPNAVGAVAIPFVNVRQDPRVHQLAPEPGVYLCSSYIGTAHAIRRDLFLKLGGYREQLFHQGEEGDLCLRMLAQGLVVRIGRADPIHHFESPRRDFRRMDIYGRRNDVLTAWYNVPWPVFPLHLLGTIVNGMKLGLAVGRPGRMALGIARGLRDVIGEWTRRQPVPLAVYRFHRMLKKQSPLLFDAQCQQLIQGFQSANITRASHHRNSTPQFNVTDSQTCV